VLVPTTADTSTLRKRMMQHWSDYLQSIEEGAKVVPLYEHAA
jgi:hypothetical protein